MKGNQLCSVSVAVKYKAVEVRSGRIGESAHSPLESCNLKVLTEYMMHVVQSDQCKQLVQNLRESFPQDPLPVLVLTALYHHEKQQNMALQVLQVDMIKKKKSIPMTASHLLYDHG